MKDKHTDKTTPKPDSRLLRDIALYLEGMLAGKGHISPLGTEHLSNLWKTVKHIQSHDAH